MYKKIKELNPSKRKVSIGIKDKQGTLRHEHKEICDRWEEYIEKELYADERGDQPEINSGPSKVDITSEEVKETIINLKNSKAPGIYNLPAEFLKSLGDEGLDLFTDIVNKIYNLGVAPEDFYDSMFINIPKVNKADQCENVRLISLISHSSKVLLHIIKRRITPPIESRLSQTQLGFIKGKGTRDGLSLMRILLERRIQKQHDLFICLIDYQKAFDRINHDKLVEIMLEWGFLHMR